MTQIRYMKYPLILLCLIFLSLALKAQPLPALKTVTIRLDTLENSAETHRASLFHHFEVLDERPDTIRIGIYGGRAPDNKQLVLARPASREIATYLDARFTQPQAAYTALVVIRTLWLSDANNTLTDLVNDPEKNHERGKLRLKAEIYAEKEGSYTPLFRFDSLDVLETGSYIRFGNRLSILLERLADSAINLLAATTGEGRKITRSAIQAFNRSRFDVPVNAGAPLEKGVMTRAWKEGNSWYFNGQVERINPGTTGSRVMAPYMGASAGAGANLAAIGLSTAVSPLLRPAKAPVEHHIFTVDMDNGNLY